MKPNWGQLPKVMQMNFVGRTRKSLNKEQMHLISSFVIYSGYFLHVYVNSNLSLSNSFPFPGSKIPKRNVLDRAQHQEAKSVSFAWISRRGTPIIKSDTY